MSTLKAPPTRARFYCGIDENGLGPRLGPLIVTSVLARADRDERGGAVATSPAQGGLERRLGDSKKLVAFHDSALGEGWARAIVSQRWMGASAEKKGEPSTPSELLSAIALDDDATLRAPCPRHHLDLCWGSEGERFQASAEVLALCKKDIARLEREGLRVVSVRVAIVCTKRLNEASNEGVSRFEVDLHTMERLALAARMEACEDIEVLAGKVGGIDFYRERFGPLRGRSVTMLCEGRERSEYLVPDLGRLAFVRDADATHLIVGLASLVGKWVRDHLTRRVIRFHRVHAPEAPEASGYHDPRTARFVEATADVRKRLAVAPECFERSASRSARAR